MILLENASIVQGDTMEKITAFEVWWQTPKGLLKSLPEALKVVELLDMPSMIVQPIVVAVSETLTEPFL